MLLHSIANPTYPMKLILILACVWCTLAAARADDVADAKAAFATMVAYQKSDDTRSLDLFAPDCTVTFTLTDGKASKVAVIPPDQFREMLTREIALKHGNPDTYEDVKYTQEGAAVRVTATILYAASGMRGPFSLLYERDKNGVIKVKEMKVTVPVTGAPNA